MSAILSEAARELLVEASLDPTGMIIRLNAMGSAYLRTNRRMLGGHGAKVYSVTPEGHGAADTLRGKPLS